MSGRLKVTVHIECAVLGTVSSLANTEQLLKDALSHDCPVFADGPLPIPEVLRDSIAYLQVCDLGKGQKVSFWQADLWIHLFRLSEQGPECDYLDGDEEIPAAEQWELPNVHIKGLWDSIVVAEDIKQKLINYCCSSILFADAHVDPNIISWNKMILLYGPPGTGKTSLCKALAQKLFVRNSHRYRSGLLFEVNAHSLFSKWFSESGKLVMKLFNHIAEVADDPDSLVVLLIDEVESIVNARSSAQRSGEPGDALRVVNAVLTSLDSLKRRANVIVLCTSNMIHALDEAFLDRLDLKIHLGNPNHAARREIIQTCIQELETRQLLIPAKSTVVFRETAELNSTYSMEKLSVAGEQIYWHEDAIHVAPYSLLFDELIDKTEDLSGRALRKLPLQAYASLARPSVSTEEFLSAMIAICGASVESAGEV